jgi:phage terminase large subunit-like protein
VKARKRAARRPRAWRLSGEPFTVPHFVDWASHLELDNGEAWVVEPFFCEFLEDFFRGYAENWLLVPEGNTKTTSMAGLALYHCEFVRWARALWAASARDQAELGYLQAEGFVQRSKRLQSIFRCHPGYRRIQHWEGSRLQIFAADDRTGDGVIPTLGLLDELHRHRNLKLYRTWRGKLLKRPGAQMATFSTAGEPGSDFEKTRDQIRATASEREVRGSHLRAVSSGVVMHEWAVPAAADVEDMAVVKAANPFSGLSVEGLRSKFDSPTMTLSHWRRFVCNLPTRDDYAAITDDEWAGAAVRKVIPKGVSVDVGLDLAWKWDTTAITPLWWKSPEYRLFAPATILVPPRNGQSLDPDLVEEALLEVHSRNPIGMLVMDTSRAEQLASWASKRLGCVVVDRGQTNTFAVEDYERFMEALRKGWLKHSGDAGLTEHALNAIARMLPGGDSRFDRPVQSRRSMEQQDMRVIDGLTAAAMVNSVLTGLANRPKRQIMVRTA